MNYRSEIDGLRAVAIIPVILFHAGFTLFKGGFVGVDIFFVISGYLISSIILSEKNKGLFSYKEFYIRRVKRIFPALFFVILTSLPFVCLWLLPSQVQEYGLSVIATSLFVANIFFWQQNGYFDTATDYKPLIHTWTLSVEEQFYIIFPVVFLMLLRLRHSQTAIVIGSVAVISLLLAQLLPDDDDYLSAKFYFLPTRIWEFLIGCLAAIFLAHGYLKIKSVILKECLSAFGLSLILLSVFLFDKNTPYPSIYTLAPTIGAFLIICFSADSLTGRILSFNVFTGIGLISYSLYLWHQPVFALARAKNITEPSALYFFFLILITTALSLFSWKFIEQPFRKKTVSRAKTISFFLVGTLILIAVGLAASQNYLSRSLSPNTKWENLGEKLRSEKLCHKTELKNYPALKGCIFGNPDSERIVALYGDSHAEALLNSLHDRFSSQNIKGIWIKAKGCGVIPGIFSISASPEAIATCLKNYNSLLKYIHENTSHIIVMVRWSFILYPIPGQIETIGFDNGEGGIEKETDRIYAALNSSNQLDIAADPKSEAVKNFVSSLASTDKKIILIYPVPEIGWDIAKLNYLYFNSHKKILDEISVPYSGYKERNSFVIRTLDEAKYRNVTKIYPESVFCNRYLENRCAAQINGVPFYYDDDHLSDVGASMIINELQSHLPQ